MFSIDRILLALRHRCPACGRGKLFRGVVNMHESCSECRLRFEPEPGFYLGAIYVNYAATVLLMTVAYVLCVFLCGLEKLSVALGCALAASVFSIWFSRYGRSIWLSLMYAVSPGDFRMQSIDDENNSTDFSSTATQSHSLQHVDSAAGAVMGLTLGLAFLTLLLTVIGVSVWTKCVQSSPRSMTSAVHLQNPFLTRLKADS